MRALPSLLLLGDPPDIDEGSPILLGPLVQPGNKMVVIGTSITVLSGYNVTINCSILAGSPPVNFTWYRNGILYSTENVSSITITDPENGDNFTCRADNHIGFDSKSTNITVESESFHFTVCTSYFHQL